MKVLCVYYIISKIIVDEINESDIQNIINTMVNNKRKPKTIRILKAYIKQILEENDVLLNWKKIKFPKILGKDKFSGSNDDAKKIAKVLLEYKHPIAKKVFFLFC